MEIISQFHQQILNILKNISKLRMKSHVQELHKAFHFLLKLILIVNDNHSHYNKACGGLDDDMIKTIIIIIIIIIISKRRQQQIRQQQQQGRLRRRRQQQQQQQQQLKITLFYFIFSSGHSRNLNKSLYNLQRCRIILCYIFERYRMKLYFNTTHQFLCQKICTYRGSETFITIEAL